MTEWRTTEPRYTGDYLCTTKTNDVMTLHWSGTDWISEDGTLVNVIAWTALPRPYEKPDKERAKQYIDNVMRLLPQLRETLSSTVVRNEYVGQVDKLMHLFWRDIKEQLEIYHEFENMKHSKKAQEESPWA